jgi:hypothetical protein
MRRFYSVNEYHGNLLTCVFAEKHAKIANPLVAVDSLSEVDLATVWMPRLVLKALHWAPLQTVVGLDHTLADGISPRLCVEPVSG